MRLPADLPKLERPRRQPGLRACIALLFVLPITLFGAACGDDEAGGPGSDEPVPAATGAQEASDDADAPDDDATGPTPQAMAVGRRLDALVSAYAPVSVRTNFLVAAETLRADAVDAGMGEEIELERFGAVRLELRRSEQLLQAVRPRVAAVAVTDVEQQEIKDGMLDAIDSRARALRGLRAALDATARREQVGDSRIEQLMATWEADWDGSLRAAREATTAMQDLRARLEIAPAREESIR